MWKGKKILALIIFKIMIMRLKKAQNVIESGSKVMMLMSCDKLKFDLSGISNNTIKSQICKNAAQEK